jgi:AraC-like DNA-binding protein
MLQKIIASQKLPSKPLKNYINTYWASYNPTDEYIDIPIVPNGCIYIFWKNGNIVMSGLTTSAYVINIAPQDKFFGIEFKPYILALLLDEEVSKFNDKFIDLKRINKKLEHDIETIMKNYSEPYDELNSFFERYFSDKIIDERLLKTLELIELSYGNMSVLDLANSVEVHPKKLERLFVQSLGVSVKKFSKIIRFYEIHKVLREEGMENLVQKVLDKGYFDQAHFNRDFKKLTGVNPSSKLMSILYNT